MVIIFVSGLSVCSLLVSRLGKCELQLGRFFVSIEKVLAWPTCYSVDVNGI